MAGLRLNNDGTCVHLFSGLMYLAFNRQILNGRPVLDLPAKHTRVAYVELTPGESDAYDRLHTNVSARYQALRASGETNSVTFSLLLLKLRRACSGGRIAIDAELEPLYGPLPADAPVVDRGICPVCQVGVCDGHLDAA